MTPSRPRHLFEYAAVRLLAGIAGALPRRAALRLGRALGTSARVLGVRVAVARANLARAFPAWPDGRREDVLREAYAQAGMSAVELLRADRVGEAERASLAAALAGREHLAAARRAGRGVVLVSGHFGAYELGIAGVATAGEPVHEFVRAQSNPWVDRFVTARRRKLGGGVVGHGPRGVREALAVLRAGGSLAVVADQDAGRDGVFVDFFGTPASTPPGPAEFALRSGAPIVLAFLRRSPGGDYAGELLVPIEPVPSGDHEADVRELTQRHVRALEAMIRAHPEQWLWTHRRWKTPPPGAPADRATRPVSAARALVTAGVLACLAASAEAADPPPPVPPSPARPESLRAVLSGPGESVFDGAGSSVFPLEPARVRRLFEDIRLRRLEAGWAVEAEEWFEAGVAPATAVMGLPDYRASLPAGERDAPARAGMRGTLRDLEVTVDGLPMAIEEIPGAAGPGEDLGGIERIFRFAVPFSAEESRSVRLSYRFGDSRTDGGEPLLFFYRNPGSLWEGESPKSTVSIDLGAMSPEDLVIGWLRPLGYRLYGAKVLWHRPAGEELADIALGIRPPADPLAVFPDRAKGPLALGLEAREEWFERLTVRDVRFFAAWLVARRGGPVPADGSGSQLAAEPWYRPSRSYRESRLSADERRLLSRLRERLLAWERARIPFRAGPPFVPEPGGPAPGAADSSATRPPASANPGG